MFVMKSNLEDRLNISTKVNPTTYDDYRYGQMKRGRGAERGGSGTGTLFWRKRRRGYRHEEINNEKLGVQVREDDLGGSEGQVLRGKRGGGTDTRK